MKSNTKRLVPYVNVVVACFHVRSGSAKRNSWPRTRLELAETRKQQTVRLSKRPLPLLADVAVLVPTFRQIVSEVISPNSSELCRSAIYLSPFRSGLETSNDSSQSPTSEDRPRSLWTEFSGNPLFRSPRSRRTAEFGERPSRLDFASVVFCESVLT